jgi:flagellar protein FlaG
MIRHSDGPVSVLAPLAAAAVAVSTASPAAAANRTPVAPEPTRGQIEQAVSRANEQMGSVAPSLQFEIDPDTQQVVIRLVDREDQRVLRQVPSVEMLAIARALERMQALLVRTRA